MSIDLDAFRDVLTRHPSGVAIVTAYDALEDVASGLTLTAFCSVSSAPPMVLVCLDRGSNTWDAIRTSGAFTVNLIAAGREELARTFASKQPDKFREVTWIDGPGGRRAGPVLCDDIIGHLACDVDQTIEAGDHWVLIGKVTHAEACDGDAPLVYCGRVFRRLT